MGDFTVMGPDGRPIPDQVRRQDILSPPLLTSETDMFKWRKQVGLWTTTVKMYAKGGDKRAKGLLSALGITLFNALDDIYSSQIEQAIAAGSINLEASDDDIMNPVEQMKTVQDIIDLVAQDSPTDSIRRLVKMLRDIFACVRKDGETPSIFARRFRSIAIAYLNESSSAHSQQDTQNFAMLLLENCKLPADVYSSVITRLVASVTQRTSTPANKIYVISKERLDLIRHEANKIRTQDAQTSAEEHQTAAESIISIAEATVKTNEPHERQDKNIFKVRLADAFFVLSDLKVPFPIESKRQQDIPKDVQKLSTMLGKREYQDNGSNRNAKKHKNSTIPSGQGPKATTRCHNCKQPNHWYKDPECIYNVIKQLMQGKEIEAEVVQKLSPEIRNTFKDEAGNITTKASVNNIVGVIGSAHNKPDKHRDQNEGAQTSTGGIENAVTLCDVLGIPLELDPPRDVYLHGWGDTCLGARQIICSWTLTVHDTQGKPTSLTFDLVAGSSPLIVGNDVRKYCNTYNLEAQPYLRIRRPTDDADRYLFTYLVPEDNRSRLDIAPHPYSVKTTLLGNIHTTAARTPLAFCKRVHRYTHATADEMKELCKEAGMLSPEIEEAIERVYAACEVCTKNGLPVPTRKVSLTHVNQAFNVEIQIDFLFPTVRGKKRTVMNITDTGTSYTVLCLTDDRSADTMIRTLEVYWICQHGAPEAVSADDEYNCTTLRKFLAAHNIQFKPRPSRRHNKTGIVERKNGTVKRILSKLDDEKSTADTETIIARSAFFSNLFSGNRVLSSFELVRGYRPSVVGLPRTTVTDEILQAHKEQTALRKLQRLMQSRIYNVNRSEHFQPGEPVWVFFKTSKQNEPVRWLKAHVVSAHPEFLEVKRAIKGRPMRVAYEDVRFAPQGELTTELMSCSLEEELGKAMPSEQTPPDTTTATPVPDTAAPTAPEPTIPPATSLLTSATLVDGGAKDIGDYATSSSETAAPSLDGKLLERDLSSDIEKIHNVIGSKQVTSSQLTFAPPHIIQEALKREHDTNWGDAYTTVADVEVPRQANVITSHVVYKIKTDENGKRAMKARIVPHGNHDDQKDDIRKDSSNAPLFIVRLLLSLATFMGFRIGTADIKGAFLQSGPITRDIYVRPPREWNAERGILWKLLKLPYGIADAGRQWQKTVEQWMIEVAHLERVIGLPQLFIKRNESSCIDLLIAKVTDDFLLAGNVREMQKFTRMLQDRFIVGKVILDDKIHFDGCEIEQAANGDITMSMVRYLERLKPIEISRSRKKEQEQMATSTELTQYRSLACTLMYLGNGVLPQAAYVTSTLQQLIPRVKVEQLITANNMLKEVLTLDPKITFIAPPSTEEIKEVIVTSFSDASFNHGTANGYGQTGLITGLRIMTKNGADLFHTIDWASSKQRRVSYSPYGAEVLACADADDRGFYLKQGLNEMFAHTNVRSELCTDSRCLYDTITTLHEARDYRLRATVQRLRNSFDSQELDVMKWIPGDANPADALTKRNPNTSQLLNQLLASGIICIGIDSGYAVNSQQWK